MTLDADGSLTVNDANGTGTISTTLKSTGTGVDVTNDAHKVDLGGYLVHKTDNDVDPVAQARSASVAAQTPFQHRRPIVSRSRGTVPNDRPVPSFDAENFTPQPLETFDQQPMVTGPRAVRPR